MLVIPEIIQAKRVSVMEHLIFKSKWKKKKKQTSPLFTALRQTHCFAHAFSLYTSLLLPSTVAEETKEELF